MKTTKLLSICTLLVFSFSACKSTGEKTGEALSEFVGGMKGGVESTLEMKVNLDESLQKEGVSMGKVILGSDSGSVDNKVSIYLIFDKDFDREISVKAYEKDKESGRTSLRVKGKKGDAAYFDFIFDKRTNIDRQYTSLVLN